MGAINHNPCVHVDPDIKLIKLKVSKMFFFGGFV